MTTLASGRRAVVFAPASVGNVGVGFDILGHALSIAGDRVTVTAIDEPVVRVAGVRGVAGSLPTDPARNTATAGLLEMRVRLGLAGGFEVTLEKGIPLGSGMGGSAASAVGSVVAANALLNEPLSRDALLPFCLVGEQVASGAMHADNVAPCLIGGLVLCDRAEPPRLTRLPVPPDLRCVLVHPHLEISTRDGRSILRREYALGEWIDQSARLAGFVAGCALGDKALIARSLEDVLIEPQRKRLVPGFDAAQNAARDAGALGCSLSGSGPSLFAWCRVTDAPGVREAMTAAFVANDVGADAWISMIDGNGAVVERVDAV